jgi:hypothetical protein
MKQGFIADRITFGPRRGSQRIDMRNISSEISFHQKVNNMNLTERDDHTFYGMKTESLMVAMLTARLFHGKKAGQSYTRLDLQDEAGTKWQIRPTSFSRRGIPASFALYHRNSRGSRGFHAQSVISRGTRSSAVRELLTYIGQHEQYEMESRIFKLQL